MILIGQPGKAVFGARSRGREVSEFRQWGVRDGGGWSAARPCGAALCPEPLRPGRIGIGLMHRRLPFGLERGANRLHRGGKTRALSDIRQFSSIR